MLRYLIDENISPKYRTQLYYHEPSLTVLVIGDDGAPARSTPDPEILKWCEQHNFILVTNDPNTIPKHLTDHWAAGHHVPRVFMINPDVSMGTILRELIRIAGTSKEDQFVDQIVFVPFQ